MIGIELAGDIPGFSAVDKAPAIQFINQLHEAGLLAIPAGARVVRLLPPLNLSREDAAEGLRIIESIAARLSP
jgi:acetylornithine/succinyldiaminopimelate/putrescine aminotransferase